eukprot:68162_1
MAPHAIIQRTMWFYSIFFVILLNISHSQRLFDGVTLIDGSEVHIDFWSTQPPQWNRLRVHATNVGGSLYYTNGQDNSSYFSAIMGWYSGLGVDLSQGKWQDMTGRGFSHANDINLNGVSLEVATQDSTGLPYLKGTLADSIVFKTTLPSYYTAIFLTRYRDTNQTTITECKRSDCAVGHRNGLVSVLYQDGSFVTSTASFSNPQTYLISTVALGYYRANGYDVPTTGTPTHTIM